jgi:hypothetical protein
MIREKINVSFRGSNLSGLPDKGTGNPGSAGQKGSLPHFNQKTPPHNVQSVFVLSAKLMKKMAEAALKQPCVSNSFIIIRIKNQFGKLAIQ